MKEVAVFRHPTGPVEVLQAEAVERSVADADRLDFSALVAAVRRRLWLFLGVTIGIFALAVVATLMMTPVYTAIARVAINSQHVQVAPSSISGSANDPVVASVSNDSSAIDTEVTVIGSRKVAARVVAMLHLDQDPEFGLSVEKKKVGILGRIKKAVFALVQPAAKTTSSAVSPEDYTITSVLQNLTVQRFNLTNAIDISFEDADPVKAAAIANAFADAYVSYQVGAKVDTSDQASGFLQTRMNQMLAQYLADSQRVQQYKVQHNLMSAGSTTLTEQEIANYNQSVAEAKAQAAADAASLRTARDQLSHGSNGEDVGEALSSGVVQSLRAQRAAISTHVADMQGRYGDKYPELAVAKRQLSDIDQQIQAEINRIISNLEAKAEVSQQRLASIEGTLSATRATLAQNNQSEVGLDQLEQAQNASQALYQSYLSRMKETAAQQGGELPDARLLSGATPPTDPTSPLVILNLALGVILGAGLGVVAILVSEWIDSGVTTAQDVETRLGQHYLGGIPTLSSVQRGRNRSPIDALIAQPHSAFSESFRNLRASISYSAPGVRPSVVMITSSLPREGKTTVAIGLARTAALQGQDTILVDCDLHRRGLNQLVDQKAQRPGLIEVLAGEAKLEDAIVVNDKSGVSVLPLYRTKSPPSAIFEGDALPALIEELRKKFRVVLLDAPPLLPIAEARVMAQYVDAVVLAVRWRKTEMGAIQSALRLLPLDRVTIAGVAITQVNMKKQAKYGYGDPGFYYQKYQGYFV